MFPKVNSKRRSCDRVRTTQDPVEVVRELNVCWCERTTARLGMTEPYPVDRASVEPFRFVALHIQPEGRIECSLFERAYDAQPKASSAMWI
jgi:hypothetical protein